MAALMTDTPSECFNTQPPEGGWERNAQFRAIGLVSTHSRLKAAGYSSAPCRAFRLVSTHSRLKAAGAYALAAGYPRLVSTHSRLKAAGVMMALCEGEIKGFNTQPPEGGWQRT